MPSSNTAVSVDAVSAHRNSSRAILKFPDVVPFAEKMASQGKVVIVAALDGTYQREGFPNILKLLPLSESIIKLMAVCMVCYREAAFTKRIGSETAVSGLKHSFDATVDRQVIAVNRFNLTTFDVSGGGHWGCGKIQGRLQEMLQLTGFGGRVRLKQRSSRKIIMTHSSDESSPYHH